MGMHSKTRIRLAGWAFVVLAGASACGTAFAQAAAPITVSNAVYQEVDVKAPDGKTTKKRVPAVKVVPGGEVVYQISYRNNGKQAATDVAINNPLPKELVFLGAEDDPSAVSVDGGQTYGKLAELTVIDDQGQVRAARPADVTNLRWVVASLAPGASGKVTYRARVK
jgi:uncharacterized repeat protein (TIGR01451 family)